MEELNGEIKSIIEEIGQIEEKIDFFKKDSKEYLLLWDKKQVLIVRKTELEEIIQSEQQRREHRQHIKRVR